VIVADQSEAIAFLSRPETYGGENPRRIDTHASVVFLAGTAAYKLKRAVVFPYLDFGTLERRKRFCDAEVAVNRRTAPEIYERTAAITREADGALAFDGRGAAVDYVVVMKRFDEAGLFDRLAERGKLTAELMALLAGEIARFHEAAEPVPGFGGYAGMAEIIEGNDENLRRHRNVFDAQSVAKLTAQSQAAAERLRALLDARRESGFVRRCHGDLHLRNICLYEGRPLLFDAIEFSDALACIDVLYDLAFLLMDLERRTLRDFGNLVFNRCLAEGSEENLRGLAALPLFLSCRAAVRAHVGADAALNQKDESAKSCGFDEAQGYLDLALALLAPRPPRLVAIGGLSGSGKSTLARALAPEIGAAPGALWLRSDSIRKRLSGVAETTRLPESAYAPEMTARVYGAIAKRAELALAAGHSVVADAVHAKPEERAALEQIAARLGVPFIGFWLEAGTAEMERRLGARGPDASDATAAVLRRQLGYPLGEISWRRIDTAEGLEAMLTVARAAIRA
jgi:aminoglycoside phosphotransferase family enzyme/predicted kinase